MPVPLPNTDVPTYMLSASPVPYKIQLEVIVPHTNHKTVVPLSIVVHSVCGDDCKEEKGATMEKGTTTEASATTESSVQATGQPFSGDLKTLDDLLDWNDAKK